MKQILNQPPSKKKFCHLIIFWHRYIIRDMWHFVTQLQLLHTNWIALNWTEPPGLDFSELSCIVCPKQVNALINYIASFLWTAAALGTIGCSVYAPLHSHANLPHHHCLISVQLQTQFDTWSFMSFNMNNLKYQVFIPNNTMFLHQTFLSRKSFK